MPPHQAHDPRLNPIVLAGATATGKSATALELARHLDGEIVSVDSMQVYVGMDVGTAKPSPEDRAAVPHHLIDILTLEQRFDASQFTARATAAITDIQSRSRVPILCGGTGLYFNAWLGGLGSSPAPDPAIRKTLENLPTEAILDELARLDPVTFDAIDPANRRRLVRALEVIRITGKPFSVQRSLWADVPHFLKGRMFGLRRDRHDLSNRIHRRVDAMFSSGLIDETRQLLDRGLALNPTASQAIGYRQIIELIQGQRSRLETVDVVKSKTRQYARRQETWFEHQLDLFWISVPSDAQAGSIASQIIHQLHPTP